MSHRESYSLDFGWRFSLGDVDGAERDAFDDSSWRGIDLPHDWSIEGPFDEKTPDFTEAEIHQILSGNMLGVRRAAEGVAEQLPP